MQLFFKFIQIITKKGKKIQIFNQLFKLFFFFSFVYNLNFWKILKKSIEIIPLLFIIRNKTLLKKTVSVPYLIHKKKLLKQKLRMLINNFDKDSKINLTNNVYKLISTCQDKTHNLFAYTQINYIAFYRYRALNQVSLWL